MTVHGFAFLTYDTDMEIMITSLNKDIFRWMGNIYLKLSDRTLITDHILLNNVYINFFPCGVDKNIYVP